MSVGKWFSYFVTFNCHLKFLQISFFPKAKKYHLSVDVVGFFTVILCAVLLSSFSDVCFLFLAVKEDISG